MFKNESNASVFTKTRLLSYALFVLSGAILVASFMLTQNVQVLKDWKLVVPIGEIHAGDTVTVKSEYTKLRDVTGTSVRYIECQNRSHVYVRYPLNEAVANRAKGNGGTGIVVKVPDYIPDIPTTCKFTVAITYDVYPWKKVNVSNSSQEFKLLPKRDVPQEVSVDSSSQIQTSPNQVPETVSGQVSSASSSKNTTSKPAAQSENSQTVAKPDGSPAPPDSQPVTDPPDNRSTLDKLPLVGGFFNSIGL